MSVALDSGAPVDPMILEDVTEIPPGSLTAGWELEACELDSMGEVVVKGRLKKHISFWKEEIKAPAAILDTIEVGYILFLKSEPTPYFTANHQSTSEHSTFVQESVAQLCSTGCVTEVHTRPFICSPLSVVVGRSGKERLVINLRHLNKFLWKQKFKYEDLRVAMLLFEKGDFLFSFDLKSGYHHVDIALEISRVFVAYPLFCVYSTPIWPRVGLLYVHQVGASPSEVLARTWFENHCILR